MGVYKRGQIWWYSYVVHGRQLRESSRSHNKREAERQLAIRKAQVIEERWSRPWSHAPRLQTWTIEFLESVEHASTRSRYRSSSKNLEQFFGNPRISEITPEWISQFQRARLRDAVRNATVNRDIAFLSVLLAKAKRLRIIGTNACSDVEKLEETRNRRQARPLTYIEELALKPFCPNWLWMLVVLLVETGLRAKKEALPLKWEDVDLDSQPGSLCIRSSKTHSGIRRVWLTDYCRSELKSWKNYIGVGYSDFIFPSLRNAKRHLTDYQDAWQKAAGAARLADRRVYDLRATFATRANACTTSDLTLAQLLGHSRTTVLPTYAKPLDENTRRMIQLLNQMRNGNLTVQ